LGSVCMRVDVDTSPPTTTIGVCSAEAADVTSTSFHLLMMQMTFDSSRSRSVVLRVTVLSSSLSVTRNVNAPTARTHAHKVNNRPACWLSHIRGRGGAPVTRVLCRIDGVERVLPQSKRRRVKSVQGASQAVCICRSAASVPGCRPAAAHRHSHGAQRQRRRQHSLVPLALQRRQEVFEIVRRRLRECQASSARADHCGLRARRLLCERVPIAVVQPQARRRWPLCRGSRAAGTTAWSVADFDPTAGSVRVKKAKLMNVPR
jgi:hypothetical protein